MYNDVQYTSKRNLLFDNITLNVQLLEETSTTLTESILKCMMMMMMILMMMTII